MRQAERRKFHYIYKITRNDGSGKYYIGMHSTDDLEDDYFGSGKILWRSIKKYGKEVHSKEILEFLPSRAELRAREKELVSEEIVNDPLCMNLKLGGEGGWDHITPDPLILRARGALGGSKSGKNNLVKALAGITKVSRQKAYATRVINGNPFGTHGRKFSENTKIKMSISGTGINNSQFGTCWVCSNGIAIKIQKTDIEKFLDMGYKKGRK